MARHVTHPDFDLKSYVDRYQGTVRILRLLYVGEKCSHGESKNIAHDAFRLALSELKASGNVAIYSRVFEQASKLGGSFLMDFPDPSDFSLLANRSVRNQLTEMESKLRVAKQQEDTSSQKKILEEMGHKYHQLGEWADAIQIFDEALQLNRSSSKELSANPDIVFLARKLIHCSVHSDRFDQVNKGCRLLGFDKPTADSSEVKKSFDKLKRLGLLGAAADVAMGFSLSLMRDVKDHSNAAMFLLYVSCEEGPLPSELIHPHDIVSYICLIALSTFNRKAIQGLLSTRVHGEDANGKQKAERFKTLLQYNPGWRDILEDFLSCEFGSCFEKLERKKLDLMLDKYIGPSVQFHMKNILNNAVIVYFSCFGSLQIPHLSTVFNCDEKAMERTLVELIAQDKIKARIDSANKVVYGRQASARNSAFESALNMGDQYSANLRALILTLSLSEQNFSVQSEKKSPLSAGGM